MDSDMKQIAEVSTSGARTVGVLGGMGPLATTDFLRKLIEQTPAQSDQEHIPVLVYSLPQIPDRSAAMAGLGPSPAPMMEQGIGTLVGAGAGCIVITCNTAHAWYEEVAPSAGVPVLHIADSVMDWIGRTGAPGRRIGLLATQATVDAGFYQSRFGQRGYDCLAVPEELYQRWVWAGISAVKAGNPQRGGALLSQAGEWLISEGADVLLLACTEIPVALQAVRSPLLGRSIDATRALAQACVDWARPVVM